MASGDHFRLLRSSAVRESIILPLTLLVGLTMLLVSPAGNFPLNDDWAYAKQVGIIIQEHRFESGVMAMAFAQTLWGGLASSLFGFSYTVLRLSTLALALATIWATGRLALEAALPRWAALLCAAVVLANPIFLNLSYTFMTEVPFMAPFTLAGLLYARSLKFDRKGDLLAAGVLAVVATSIRQFGVIIPVAYAAAETLLLIAGRRSFDPRRLSAFLLPWAAAGAVYLLMPGLGGRPPALQDPGSLTALIVLRRTVRGVATGLVYGGLFLLPLALGRLWDLLRRPASWPFSRRLALPLLCLAVFLGTGRYGQAGPLFRPMPLLGNILYNLGTGPLTLRDTYLWGMPRPVTVGQGWWWALTALSILSIAVTCVDTLPPLAKGLFRRAADHSGEKGQEGGGDTFAVEIFLLLWAAGILAAPYHLVMTGAFDRYLIPALPPLVVLAGRSLRSPVPRSTPAVLAVLSILFALPSLACVQDYMSWNRARWQALDHLRVDYGAQPIHIDGGYEFNASFTRDAYPKATGANPHDWGEGGFWVIGDTFAVSFNPRRGYNVAGRFPYFSWLGMEERSIMALRRPL